MAIKEDLERFFPIWNKLKDKEKTALSQGSTYKSYKKGTIIHNGFQDCIGLLLIKNGRLRVHKLNQDGRGITLYRLFERDICLFSASCIMKDIQFDVIVEAETDVDIIIINPAVYQGIMEVSVEVSNYTNQLMASRFSEVMWLMEQIMFKSFDTRLAGFLYEQSNIEGTQTVGMTHEKIAGHLGSAREVVSRMLKYFQNEGIVDLFRGGIEIVDRERLLKVMEK